MAEISSNVSNDTINISGLNSPVRRQGLTDQSLHSNVMQFTTEVPKA